MYAVEVEYGNGYSCGCCRSTWNETEEFETLKDAQERIAQVELSSYKDSKSDIYVTRFYKVEEHLDENSKEIQAMVKQMKKEYEEKERERKAREKAQRKKRAEEQKKAREKKKREQYEKLKAEFEGAES